LPKEVFGPEGVGEGSLEFSVEEAAENVDGWGVGVGILHPPRRMIPSKSIPSVFIAYSTYPALNDRGATGFMSHGIREF
jgi:hypothetical protein